MPLCQNHSPKSHFNVHNNVTWRDVTWRDIMTLCDMISIDKVMMTSENNLARWHDMTWWNGWWHGNKVPWDKNHKFNDASQDLTFTEMTQSVSIWKDPIWPDFIWPDPIWPDSIRPNPIFTNSIWSDPILPNLIWSNPIWPDPTWRGRSLCCRLVGGRSQVRDQVWPRL
jgi:hypothetical protein